MAIREYLISVTAAAIISSCITAFFENAGSISKLIKVLCGIFVSLAVIRPIAGLDISAFQPQISAFSDSAEQIVSAAQEDSAQQQRNVIKEQAEAYVYNKATALGSKVSVCISLCDSPPYQPESIEISGQLSPFAKSQLSTIIQTDLGIPSEAQKWSS